MLTTDSIWSNSYVPYENSYTAGSYEVGVKFMSTIAGDATGIRFYKQTWMGGYLHVGHLWSSTGTLLATATFTSETAEGWQQVNLSTPVPILANTEYIVSFSTGGGYFGITTGFFNYGGVTNGPLEALPNSVLGGDGVYNRAGQFPDVDSNGMNFWADVAFSPGSGGIPAAKVFGGVSESVTAGGFGIAALGAETGQSTQLLILAPAATPTRPVSYFTGSGGTTPTVLGPLPSGSPVAQARRWFHGPRSLCGHGEVGGACAWQNLCSTFEPSCASGRAYLPAVLASACTGRHGGPPHWNATLFCALGRASVPAVCQPGIYPLAQLSLKSADDWPGDRRSAPYSPLRRE